MSAAGEAVVAWSFQPRAGAPRELWAAVAAPGRRFRAPVRIGELRAGSPFDLAVGDAGHALLAFATGDRPARGRARARRGLRRRGPRRRRPRTCFAVFPAAAVRADGGAVVAWLRRLDGADERRGPRSGPGRSARRVTITRPRAPRDLPRPLLASRSLFGSEDDGEFGSSGACAGRATAATRARRSPADGRALLTWAARGEPRRRLVERAALGDAAARGRRRVERARTAPSCATSARSTPVVLAGRHRRASPGPTTRATRRPRHLARRGRGGRAGPGRAARAGAAPASARAQGAAISLVLPVTCSAACDVRAPGRRRRAERGRRRLSLRPRRRARELELAPSLGPIAPLRGGPVRVLVRYGAPGARRARPRRSRCSCAGRPARRCRGPRRRSPAATATTSS